MRKIVQAIYFGDIEAVCEIEEGSHSQRSKTSLMTGSVERSGFSQIVAAKILSESALEIRIVQHPAKMRLPALVIPMALRRLALVVCLGMGQCL